ncbi:MAG: hemolysin III family protein [Eubacteriales bacterium]
MTKTSKPFNPYDALRLWSALTHGIGAVLALLGTIILIAQAWFFEDYLGIIVFGVYGVSMVVLYTASTLYHSVNTTEKGRLALRKFDHCSIYLLIAGSYTPICLIALANKTGYTLCIVIWACALVGIILTSIKLSIPRWVSSVIYLAMGWMALFAIVPLSKVLSPIAMGWLVLGGLVYTCGGVLYALKLPLRDHPRFGCHEIFHLLILGGSVCHFVMMLFL